MSEARPAVGAHLGRTPPAATLLKAALLIPYFPCVFFAPLQGALFRNSARVCNGQPRRARCEPVTQQAMLDIALDRQVSQLFRYTAQNLLDSRTHGFSLLLESSVTL